NSRIEVLHRWELVTQLRFEFAPPRFPAFAQLLGGSRIEGDAICGDPIADGGDVVLEFERRTRVAVRLQQLPKPLADDHIAYAASLDFGGPFREIVDLDADLRYAESNAPGFESVLSINLTEGCILRPCRDLAVDLSKVRQDQSPGNQRINNSACRPWCPF